MLKKIIHALIWIYSFFCCTLFILGFFFGCAQAMYGNFSLTQFMFHLAKISTMNFSVVIIITVLIPFIASSCLILLALKRPLLWLRNYISQDKITQLAQHKISLSLTTSTITALLGIIIIASMSAYPLTQIIPQIKESYTLFHKSKIYDTIIDENFTPPQQITFQQETPHNLIIIFAESLENTFTNATIFGQNLLPNLMKQKGTSFIGYEKSSEVSWTYASIVSTLCGITYKTYFPSRKLSDDMICISDIMNQNGYNTYYLQGTSLKFADVDKFLKAHHFTSEGIEELPRVTPDKLSSLELYSVNFVGDILDDIHLLKIFREKITQLTQSDKPFLAITATMNTHPFHGHTSPNCSRKYKDMRDAILCSDTELSEFIQWFQQQDFAPNTTLIIMGDHLMMYNDMQKYLDKVPHRTTLNLMWGYAAPKENIEKPFNQFDWAPTLLEMAGFDWNEKKFALGTSLLSDEKTLLEKYGKQLDQRLLNNSKLYENSIFIK